MSYLIPDGSAFRQGRYGSCQSLAVMNGILRTKGGNEYLESLIKTRAGGYNVEFPGREPIFVSNRELNDDHRLMDSNARGLKILEKSTLYVHEKEGVVNPYRLYMGKQGDSYMVDIKSSGKSTQDIASSAISTNLMDQVKDGKAVMVGNVFAEKKGEPIYAKTVNGETINMPTNHAYSLSLKGNNIQVENPHDTSHPYELTREEASKTFKEIYVGNSPNSKIQFPPQLENLRELALNKSEKRQESLQSMGAYSIDDKDRPENPAKRAASDRADAALAAAIEKTNEQFQKSGLLSAVTPDANQHIAPAPSPNLSPAPNPNPGPAPAPKPAPVPPPAPVPEQVSRFVNKLNLQDPFDGAKSIEVRNFEVASKAAIAEAKKSGVPLSEKRLSRGEERALENIAKILNPSERRELIDSSWNDKPAQVREKMQVLGQELDKKEVTFLEQNAGKGLSGVSSEVIKDLQRSLKASGVEIKSDEVQKNLTKDPVAAVRELREDLNKANVNDQQAGKAPQTMVAKNEAVRDVQR